MAGYFLLFLCFYNFIFCHGSLVSEDVIRKQNYIFWPNASIPFYITPEHFDQEQTISIMTSMSLIAFKTCLKFSPVMAPPEDTHHVLVFHNPGAVRQCNLNTDGHSIEEPHIVTLGYDCLKSPQIDMVVMKALGFPFEHNRASRDLFIDVQFENIKPDAIELYTKDPALPLELRALPYDVNSVMHFGDRDFSKNGHRTIIFKNHKTVQNRAGLSDIDLRKIEIVYGPECQKRDRQEKKDLCQIYPGVVRKKREVIVEDNKNLRVNRNITPPPQANLTNNVTNLLKELEIEDEVEEIIDEVYKVAAIALQKAREKYCNGSKSDLRSSVANKNESDNPSVLGIIEAIAKFTKSFVDITTSNLTMFCETRDVLEVYQRTVCNWGKDPRCSAYYHSTKSGAVKHNTQHRPVYYQSTKHEGKGIKYQYDKMMRSSNITLNEGKENATVQRRKREAHRESDKAIIGERRTRAFADEMEGGRKSGAKSKKTLRSVTSIIAPKRGEYAPGRRNRNKRFRPYDSQNSEEELMSTRGKIRNIKSRYEIIKSDVSEDDRYKVEKLYEDSEIRNKEEVEEKRYKKKERKKGRQKLIRSEKPQTVTLSKINREFYNERMWPDGIVRYIIEDNHKYDLDDLRRRIKQVNDILLEKTCVRLEEITEDDSERFADYLVLNTSPDYVTGRVGGRQVFGSVELFSGVSHRQHTAMMVMAMLGFYFEVARHDRDDYVVVHYRHIRPDKLHHFEKIREDATLPLPYDFASATHPCWQFWRRIGKSGISSVATYKDKDPDGVIMKKLGQNSQLLSDLDIVKINSVYGIKCFERSGSNGRNNKA